LVWPGALVAAGVIAYQQRRLAGRPNEAVQAGLWCIGMAVLFLIGFVWPGVLFLAGASLLIRGREDAVEAGVQRAVTQMRQRRGASRPIPTQQVPITTQQIPVTRLTPQVGEPDAPSTGETRRL
jgi:hypothetical protein